jgi:DNA polymerase-1
MERLHILDGYGYIFRAHYGLLYGGKDRQTVRLTTSRGEPTGALYVYTSMLIRLLLDVKPERIVVVFDAPGRSFRESIDPGYKANRTEMPEDLVSQMPHFRPLTEAFAWPVLSKEGFEADDVIATLVTRARKKDWDVVLYSADKDLMQLVDDHVVMIDAMRDKTYDRAAVIAKFGVPPSMVSEYLALVGDSSDNIPGVAGVGPKTASKLLSDYGSIDNLLAHAHELTGKTRERFTDPVQLERLARSRKLVALETNVPLEEELESFVQGSWEGDRLRQKLLDFEFEKLVERLEGKRALSAVPREAPAQPALPTRIATTAGDLADEVLAAKTAREIAIWVLTDDARADRARAVGFAVAVPGRNPLYVPLGHRYLSAPTQFGERDLQALADLFCDPSMKAVCHDLKTTLKQFARLGIDIPCPVEDTMLDAYLIDASIEEYGPEAVLGDSSGQPLIDKKEVIGTGKKAIPYESVAVDRAAEFAGAIAGAILPASKRLEAKIDSEGLTALKQDLELPLARLLARIEEIGVCIDVPHLKDLSNRVGKEIAALEARAYELAGETFNLGSPKQLATVLFDKLGLKSDRMRKNKTGYSTDYEVLDAMREIHPIIDPILTHRELVKLKNTYIDALPPLINPKTGRLHTEFRQAVAATGRLSSVDPNLQNIPIRSERGLEIRRAFIAPPGHLLLSADYSQIELRVLAHLSEDPTLVHAFQNDIDVHTQTAAEVFGIALDAVGPAERRVAKAVNYGLAYGQSEFGLARALDIPRAEAAETIARYFERFPTVSKFMEELTQRARREGVARTLLGRRRPVPDIHAKNYQRRAAAERIAQNMPMQGSAADIMKLAMLKADRALAGKNAKMLLTVHDELLFEIPEREAKSIEPIVRDAMESAFELRVPLKVDIGIAKNWADT